MFSSLLLCGVLGNALAADWNSPECKMCMDIVFKARQSSPSELEKSTKTRAMQGADAYTDPAMKDKYRTELLCHWDKYYADANFNLAMSPLSTCADTGLCPIKYQVNMVPYKDITDITRNYYTNCNNPKVIVIHHTAIASVEETIATMVNRSVSVQYIVNKNGTIYKMVNEWYGAWHAGSGNWRTMKSINTRSIGIENVNDGHSNFPAVQMQALSNLVSSLQQRWSIQDYNIIGHHDYSPDRKDDPSGYFPWQTLYSNLGIYPNLFNSTLTPDQTKKVLISPCSYDEYTLNRVQNGLERLGYTSLTMTPGLLDESMLLNMESFNRHFCPEVFVKETYNKTTSMNNRNAANQRWFGLSDERLDYLLEQM